MRHVDAETMRRLNRLDGQTVEILEIDLLEDVDGVPLAVNASREQATLVMPAGDLLGWPEGGQEYDGEDTP